MSRSFILMKLNSIIGSFGNDIILRIKMLSMFYNTKIMLFRQMEPRDDPYYLNIGSQQNNPQTGFK